MEFYSLGKKKKGKKFRRCHPHWIIQLAKSVNDTSRHLAFTYYAGSDFSYSPTTSINLPRRRERISDCTDSTRVDVALHPSISTFPISLLVYPVGLPFRHVVAVYTKAEPLRRGKDFVKPQIGPTFHPLYVTSLDSQFDPRKYRLY